MEGPVFYRPVVGDADEIFGTHDLGPVLRNEHPERPDPFRVGPMTFWFTYRWHWYVGEVSMPYSASYENGQSHSRGRNGRSASWSENHVWSA